MRLIKNVLMTYVLLTTCSCASNYEYRPYREYGFSCAELGSTEEVKCIEMDGDFDGTDFHKEYDVDINSWYNLK